MASDSIGVILANDKMETLINGDFSGKFDTEQTWISITNLRKNYFEIALFTQFL